MRGFLKRTLPLLLVAIMLFSLIGVMPQDRAQAASPYKIRVNVQRNVATVYKRKNNRWKPIRAMLVSTGQPWSPTPVGTFRTTSKYSWRILYGPVRGRYCTRLGNTNYLFHSVWYPMEYSGGGISHNKTNMSMRDFRKLGSPASQGCIRLSVMDAKWIYDNIPTGTVVQTYKSSTSSPLGRPKRVPTKKNSSFDWCPTDSDPNNPHFYLRKARFDLSKKPKVLSYGSTLKLKSYVTAQNPNVLQDISDTVKVSRLYRWSNSKNKYVRMNPEKFSTRKPGYYKVWYRTHSAYCKNASTSFKFRVRNRYEKDKPLFSVNKKYYKYKKKGSRDGINVRNIKVGWKNPHLGVRVVLNKHTNKYVTYKMTSNIYKRQKDGSYKLYRSFKSDRQARNYTFTRPGNYIVYFKAVNPYAVKGTKAARPRYYRVMVNCKR